MSQLSKSTLLIVMLLIGAVFVSTNITYAAPKTAAWLDANVPDFNGSAQGRVVFWESSCTTNLNQERSDPSNAGDARTIVNAAAYLSNSWISRLNDPDRSTGNTFTAGQTVNLQLNQLLFLCAIVTSPVSGTTYPRPQNQVTNTQYPNDRDPGTIGTVNEASKFEINTRIDRITVSGMPGASVSATTPSFISTTRDANSRYWPANRFPFSLSIPSSVSPGVYNITIRADYKRIDTYHNYGAAGTSRCTVNAAGLSQNVPYGSFASCHTLSVNYNYTLRVVAPTPPSPPTIALSGNRYEKGAGGNVALTARVECRSLTGPVTLILANSSSMPAVPNGSVTCAVNESRTYDFQVNNGNVLNGYAVGDKRYTVSIQSPAITSAVSVLNIYEVPYARFYGNEVYASSAPRFNYADADRGSGAQYAVIANTLVSSMRLNAAAFRTTSPSRPDGLKAQNNNAPNAYTDITANLPAVSSTSVDWSNNGYYDTGASASLSAAGVSKKVTVRADTVRITGNITAGAIPNPFNDANTPVIVIISDGNIYIDSSVQRIDAVLIARGTIYTCASGGAEVARTNWHTTCGTKLTVNGAMAADGGIRFARSTGTRLLATSNEDSATAGRTVIGASAGADNQAAEVINFPAYLYYASPFLTDKSKSGYQALFNGPPYL